MIFTEFLASQKTPRILKSKRLIESRPWNIILVCKIIDIHSRKNLDKNQEPGADAKFKDINAAYECLSDQKKKSTYDQFGEEGLKEGGGGGGFGGGFGGDPNEIFRMFFGGGGMGGRGGRGNPFGGRGGGMRYFIAAFQII